MPADTGRSRLRELRDKLGWTQQQLADKLAHLAWTHGQGHAAVNTDTVAKRERGVKSISPRYRAPLRPLFGAASLLDQLGAAGTALAPQMLAAWKDTVTSRRTMLGLLDPATTDPAGHPRATTATVTHLERLAHRYQTLHATADPAALLTPVAAHVRMGDAVMTTDDCELLDEGTP